MSCRQDSGAGRRVLHTVRSVSALYIHIPFCVSRCAYCAFYSTTRLDCAERYVAACRREMSLRRDVAGSGVTTVYIGGGTPSVLPVPLIEQLLEGIDMTCAVEVTVECNPDDVTASLAGALGRMGVNRVSVGVQTFDDTTLRRMGRRHDAADAVRAVDTLRAAGIANISIDLMYGFPGETVAQWERDVSAAVRLGVEHVSAYLLSYEEGTPLYSLRESGRVTETDEETCARMYYVMTDMLADAGYEHYEISNFARQGFRSRHNSAYWTGVPYAGIGAAAHSYDGACRAWNIADLDSYMNSIERGVLPAERETLDTHTQYNDMMMLALRTTEGVSLRALAARFGDGYRDYCLRCARTYLDGGLLHVTADGRLRLTRRGLFVSDMVMADLMIV